nr:hypothetical protein [uncultured Cohaesibacter sp.]
MGIFQTIESFALTTAGLASVAAPPTASPVKTERRSSDPPFLIKKSSDCEMNEKILLFCKACLHGLDTSARSGHAQPFYFLIQIPEQAFLIWYFGLYLAQMSGLPDNLRRIIALTWFD